MVQVLEMNPKYMAKAFSIGDLKMPIVPPDIGFKVLGTQFALVNTSAMEIQNRMSAA